MWHPLRLAHVRRDEAFNGMLKNWVRLKDRSRTTLVACEGRLSDSRPLVRYVRPLLGLELKLPLTRYAQEIFARIKRRFQWTVRFVITIIN